MSRDHIRKRRHLSIQRAFPTAGAPRPSLATKPARRDHLRMGFSLAQNETLAAAANRIIPEDDFPGAWDVGVGEYITRILATDLRDRAGEFELGLTELEQEAIRHFSKSFAALEPGQQDRILAAAQEARPRFFELLVILVSEGFYSDPGSGGNRNRISWRMVGYDPKT